MDKMKVLQFRLSGKTAFFKKPDVNTYAYFTYGNIHKVAMLGMFGAIMGYKGYSDQYKTKDVFPEFYEKLSMLKISIIPINQNGFFPKKMQVFNNSVGYASEEQGGNLIVKEQWLEKPCWKICVLLDCDEANKLADNILKRKSVYVPYLGKNDHFADISEVKITECAEVTEFEKISSLFYREYVVYGEKNRKLFSKLERTFKYEEYLPVGLDEELNMYILKALVHTNLSILKYDDAVYDLNGEKIVFI